MLFHSIIFSGGWSCCRPLNQSLPWNLQLSLLAHTDLLQSYGCGCPERWSESYFSHMRQIICSDSTATVQETPRLRAKLLICQTNTLLLLNKHIGVIQYWGEWGGVSSNGFWVWATAQLDTIISNGSEHMMWNRGSKSLWSTWVKTNVF